MCDKKKMFRFFVVAENAANFFERMNVQDVFFFTASSMDVQGVPLS
jgi:hypothetical protein